MKKIKIERLSDTELKGRGIERWDTWEKEPSEFDWSYVDEEHCYIIEGRANIETDDGTVEIKKGDFVVFPVGLKCRWSVVEKIRKYYSFK
jgi:uncharacterized cupin superfamily protein